MNFGENPSEMLAAVIKLTSLTHTLKGTYEIVCCKDMFETCKALHMCAKASKLRNEVNPETCKELQLLRAAFGGACDVMFSELGLLEKKLSEEICAKHKAQQEASDLAQDLSVEREATLKAQLAAAKLEQQLSVEREATLKAQLQCEKAANDAHTSVLRTLRSVSPTQSSRQMIESHDFSCSHDLKGTAGTEPSDNESLLTFALWQ